MSTATTEIEAEIVEEREIEGNTGLMALNKSEIDQQIATAKRYPRSIKRFVNTAREMVTLSEDVAGECIYSLPRGGKPIEGPSARFAEVIASAWGNCRAGARVIDEDDRFITSQGFFLDVENNMGITYEVRRRITNKKGEKFNDDMVGVTGNAACSIALRNAVLKGVPKAFWNQIYQDARKTAIGDAETLVGRRVKMMKAFANMGVRPEQIFATLEIKGEEDIGLDHLAMLRGVFTAIKEGDTTVDQAFGGAPVAGGRAQNSTLTDKLKEKTETVKTVESTAETTQSASSDEWEFSDKGREINAKLADAAGNKPAPLGLLQEVMATFKGKLECKSPEGLFFHNRLDEMLAECTAKKK